MKRKARFRVGQVICLPKGELQPRDRYGKVMRLPRPDEKAILTTDGYWYLPHVRPLTRREKDAIARERDEAADKLAEALQGIIDIGKRDLTNPKYDGYFTSAKEALAAYRERMGR